MEIVREPIDLIRLRDLAANRFGDLVKAVVEVDRGIMAIDAELHSDEEAELLDDGSRQSDLWGINVYPADYGTAARSSSTPFNVRPSQGNRSRSVEDASAREGILQIVERLVKP